MSLVFPGQKVIPVKKISNTNSSEELISAGLYYNPKSSFLHATLFGKLSVISSSETGSTSYKIIHPISTPTHNSFRSERISPITCTPKIGDLVIGKVTKISQRNVSVNMLLKEESETEYLKCSIGHSGIIRLNDIHNRIFDTNTLNITISSFRPGDIVRARVLAIGEGQMYYLSTASPDLGVIYARGSMTGDLMIPISAEEMICPNIHMVETRKVAAVEQKES